MCWWFYADGNCADTLKGSFYANPIVDQPTVSDAVRQAYPEYYGQNICAFVGLLYRSSANDGWQGPIRAWRKFRALKMLSRI